MVVFTRRMAAVLALVAAAAAAAAGCSETAARLLGIHRRSLQRKLSKFPSAR